MTPPTFYRRAGKRLIDLAVALPLLILFTPVLALLMLMVRVQLGAPVFFQQQRPGLHGKPFLMVKFRAMTDARDAQGVLLPDAERLTAFRKSVISV